MSTLSIASICPRMAIADAERNLESVRSWSARAARRGAWLVLFPEMFISGYIEPGMGSPKIRRRLLQAADRVPGPTTARLCELSCSLGIVICVGLLESDGAKRFNTQVLVHPRKGLLGKYRKVHVGPGESWMVAPGNAFPVFDVDGVGVGIMLCRDKSFPESARILALGGAQILLAPHSTTESAAQRFREWSLKLCTARAMENGCYVIANNAIYDCAVPAGRFQAGFSYAIDPNGRIVACDTGQGTREKSSLVECDLKILHERRRREGAGFNLWGRRPEAYAALNRKGSGRPPSSRA